MKVLHITPSYFPAFKYGGPIQSVHLLNKELIKNGVDVDVITTNAGLENSKEIKLNEWNNIDDVKVRYFKYHGYEHFNFSPGLFFEISRRVKLYDLIHITAVWNFPVLVAGLLSILHKKPFIISPRGSLYKESFDLKSKYLKKLNYSLITKHIIKKVTALHFTTNDEKEKVVSYLRLTNSNFIIPNGINLEEYEKLPEKGFFKNKYNIPKNKKYILFLGRINRKKGFDILINSMSLLNKKHDDLMLVIAGPDNDNYKIKIKKMLSDFGISNKSIFVDTLVGTEKNAAYVDAELFVLPSYSENFGMAVIESLACGTPVVISENVAIHDDIKNYDAGVVTKTDVNSICNAIELIMNNKEKKDNFIKNGKRLVNQCYNIKEVSKEMIKEYKRLLQ